MHRDDIPDEYEFKQRYLPETVEWINSGDSTIIDPDGKFVVEPVKETEKILLAEIDREKLQGPGFQLDVCGHYARPDVFQLSVDREPKPMIRTVEERSAEDPLENPAQD